MPLYEYQCEACGSRFEKIRKFSDPPLEVCDKCGKGPVTKQFSSPAIQFKGSGFYITDYPKKSSSESGGKSSGTDSSASSGSESKKSEAPAPSEKSGSEKSGSDKPAKKE